MDMYELISEGAFDEIAEMLGERDSPGDLGFMVLGLCEAFRINGLTSAEIIGELEVAKLYIANEQFSLARESSNAH